MSDSLVLRESVVAFHTSLTRLLTTYSTEQTIMKVLPEIPEASKFDNFVKQLFLTVFSQELCMIAGGTCKMDAEVEV